MKINFHSEGLKNDASISITLSTIKIRGDKSMKVKCNGCSTILDVELVYDEVDREERNMGIEIMLEALSEVDCPSCEKSLSVKHQIWEIEGHPPSHEEVKLSGCQQI